MAEGVLAGSFLEFQTVSGGDFHPSRAVSRCCGGPKYRCRCARGVYLKAEPSVGTMHGWSRLVLVGG